MLALKIRQILLLLLFNALPALLSVATANSYHERDSNLARSATITTSYVSGWENLNSVNDGFSPAGSHDRSHGIYGNYSTNNTFQWIQYEWPKRYKLNSTEIYWFTDDGGLLIPDSASIEYWDGNSWLKAGALGVEKDKFNFLPLNGIVTSKVRVLMKNSSQSTAVIEWKVAGESNLPAAIWSNSSFAMNGLTQFLQVPSGILRGAKDFAISFWVKINTSEGGKTIIDFGANKTNRLFISGKSDANSLRYTISTSGPAGTQYVEGPVGKPLKTGTWQHILVSQTGNICILYLNGTEIGRNSKMILNPSKLGTLVTNFIGKSQNGDSFLDGQIKEFKLFATPPSEEQIPELLLTKNASQPSPADKWHIIESGVKPRLSWTPATFFTGYNIYLSNSFDEAAKGSVPTLQGIDEGTNSVEIPIQLVVGNTYYWRVDVINGSETRRGEVWKFRFVPPKMKVFLLGGQSNMVGCSPLKGVPDSLNHDYENVMIYASGEIAPCHLESWGNLKSGMGTNANYFGPELTFGPAMAGYFPQENIVLIKCAWGGTNLWSQWRPPGSGGKVGDLYTSFVKRIRKGLDSLPAEAKPEIAGMIWMQGESDAFAPHSDEYEFNLSNLIKDIRSEFNLPGMPFVIGQINNAPAWPDSAKVKKAQLNVSLKVPNTGLVTTTDYLLCDPYHYDAAGQLSLGKRFALKMVELLRGDNEQGALSKEYLVPDTLRFSPFIWKSTLPAKSPFKQSKQFTSLAFLGYKSGFHYGDTWYPSWAEDDKMYSPWTDGNTWRLDGNWEEASSGTDERAATGNGVIEGDDPMTLKAYSIGIEKASALPYHGRYPAGTLVFNKVWYYGTYCLDPSGWAKYGNSRINWPWMGPFVGFRYSTDYGKSWTACPLTPEKPLFRETGINGYPVKIGAPHFVDFGKNMEHSPDGKAYLIAHGADINDLTPRFWNDSWINGDQIYLLRVTPSIENMNDLSKYEFFAGNDNAGKPQWTNDFGHIKPLIEWDNNMGCVTVTYNAPLKKFLMCITDGGNTCSKMNTYILESDKLTGEWKVITYMKDFGEQAYFVNIPSKFISKDGLKFWLAYSGNFATDWNGMKIIANPPGSHYGLVLQKVELLK